MRNIYPSCVGVCRGIAILKAGNLGDQVLTLGF